jgi:hypothetical protein
MNKARDSLENVRLEMYRRDPAKRFCQCVLVSLGSK